MKVSINRASDIPLHDQLVTQIALLIAAGVLKPGQRLPSVRDLAGRLEVHRNTVSAVYNTLQDYGVVTVKLGSGVRVIEQQRPAAAWHEGVALKHLVLSFLADAREAGYSDAAIREAIDLAMRPEKIERLLVVDPHEDFHPIYRHELARSFRFPVETRTIEQLTAGGHEALEGALLLTSLYHLTPLQEQVGHERRVVVFQVNAGENLLGQVKALPAGQTLGLVSVSDTLVRMAREIVAGLRGEELLLLEAHPDDAEALRALARLSDVLLVDSPSREAMRRQTAKPFWDFQLIPEDSLRTLAQQLPAEAFVGVLPE